MRARSLPSGSVHGSRWGASQAAVRVPGKVGKAEIAEGSGDDDLLTAAGMLQQINLCERRCSADGHWILSGPLPVDGMVGVERSRRGAGGTIDG